MSLGSVRVGHRNRDEGIYIGRPSVFQNVHRAKDIGRTEAIRRFEVDFDEQLAIPGSRIEREVRRLAQRVAAGESLMLTCWCAPRACHGDIVAVRILWFAERLSSGTGSAL